MRKMLVCIVILLGLTTWGSAYSQNHNKAQQGRNLCNYWQSRADKTVKAELPDQKIDYDDDQTILDAIECLLKMEGNKHPARFGGAARDDVSQLIPLTTADVAALYYISFLYYKKYDHANGVALRDGSHELNREKAIRNAYKSYKKWLAKVKKIGLAKAREQHLSPLAGSGVGWY